MKELSVESYIGAPFLQTDGWLLGLLVVMNNQHINDKDLYSALEKGIRERT
jgi:hypothetical protein